MKKKNTNSNNGLGIEKSLGSSVINLRKNKGLSQMELAEKMGSGQSRISRLENGTLNPSLSFLKRLAEALGQELSISFAEKKDY